MFRSRETVVDEADDDDGHEEGDDEEQEPEPVECHVLLLESGSSTHPAAHSAPSTVSAASTRSSHLS